MSRWTATLLLLLLAATAAAQEEGPVRAEGTGVDTTGKGYTAALVVEATSGQVLFAENADRILPTASMAKMMTCLIAMDEIRDGKLTLATPVMISARAAGMGGSQIYAQQGQVFTLQTLLAATMVQSANDAATAIAEQISGSEEAFAAVMNERARQLGLRHSVFYDPHGLPNPRDPQRVDQMSANDLATLARALLKYPLMRDYARTPTLPFSNGTFTAGLTNPNHLIQRGKRDYYPAATGVKTGYSVPAGYCVTAGAERGNTKLICVVMGARHSSGPQSSFGIASRLLNEVFAKYTMATVLRKGTTAGHTVVTGGRAKAVPAVAAADVQALVPRGTARNLTVAFTGRSLAAPIRRGQPVGTLSVRQGAQTIATVPAVAGAAVETQAWWQALWPF